MKKILIIVAVILSTATLKTVQAQMTDIVIIDKILKKNTKIKGDVVTLKLPLEEFALMIEVDEQTLAEYLFKSGEYRYTALKSLSTLLYFNEKVRGSDAIYARIIIKTGYDYYGNIKLGKIVLKDWYKEEIIQTQNQQI